MRAAISAGGPGIAAQPDARHHGAGRQRRVAVGECQLARGAFAAARRCGSRPRPSRQRLPCPRRRRRHSSPRRRRSSRECRTGIPAPSAPRQPHVPRPSRPARRHRRQPRRLPQRSVENPRASRIVTPGRPPSRTIRLEQAPITCTGTSSGSAARNADRSSASAGRTSTFRRPAGAKPGERRQRRVGLHPPPQRRQRLNKAGNSFRGHHAALPAARARVGLQRRQVRPAARPPIA